MWDGTVFVYKVRHDFVGNKSTIYFRHILVGYYGKYHKGTNRQHTGNTARVVPSDAGAKPTAKITIPWHLRGSTGNLSKGHGGGFNVEFDDSTGLLLGRADG